MPMRKDILRWLVVALENQVGDVVDVLENVREYQSFEETTVAGSQGKN